MDKRRINEMLQHWAEIYRSNPTKSFSDRHFYHHLIFQGVKPEDREVNLGILPSKVNPDYRKALGEISPLCHPNSPFNNWIQYYADSPQTSCFVAYNWQYFCQFISKDNQARLAGEHIKIYIPLDAQHIEEGAKIIFDFLEKNHISHLSKIGREIRFDDIVVRLINPEDAKKLIQFVSSVPYLQEGLIQANPFAFQQNGIAMAVDGSLSFNSTVAKLLNAYMDYKRNSGTLNNVNADDFYAYLRALYLDQFVYHRNNNLERICQWEPDEENNYREVIALIIKVQDPSFTLEDYMQHYATCADVELLTESKIFETNRLLIEAIQAMTLRWGKNGIPSVRDYYDTGDPTYITRRNDLRDRMENSKFRATLKAILHQRRMSFNQYAQVLLDQYHIDLDQLLRDNGFDPGSGPKH